MLAPSWTARIWSAFHAGYMTRVSRDVLLTLATYRAPGGIAWPSHQTLADRCRCSVRSVQRALAAGKAAGLLEWCGRWRGRLRTSNVYRFVSGIATVQRVRMNLGSIAIPGSRFTAQRRPP